jgi:hypothetical protein
MPETLSFIAALFVVALLIGAGILFGGAAGGIIGRPEHEVTVDPAEEPVPNADRGLALEQRETSTDFYGS